MSVLRFCTRFKTRAFLYLLFAKKRLGFLELKQGGHFFFFNNFSFDTGYGHRRKNNPWTKYDILFNITRRLACMTNIHFLAYNEQNFVKDRNSSTPLKKPKRVNIFKFIVYVKVMSTDNKTALNSSSS